MLADHECLRDIDIVGKLLNIKIIDTKKTVTRFRKDLRKANADTERILTKGEFKTFRRDQNIKNRDSWREGIKAQNIRVDFLVNKYKVCNH